MWVGEGEKIDSSSEFDDVFDVDLFAPSPKDRKKKPIRVPHVSGITTMFATMTNGFGRVEAKVDRLERGLAS